MARAADAAIDWVAVRREAQAILTDYLRIDTSNPPGNEAAGARFLGRLLEAEGIPTRYFETAPGREILYARIPGDGSRGAFMLCNHIDVVPVERAYWTKPAFEGIEEGNRIYGRGAVDMKGFAVMQLLAVLLLRRRGIPLKRDLVFCAVPDEEALGTFGMRWLCDHHPELVEDVEFELNEGGSGSTEFPGSDREVYAVATTEKQVCWMRLTAVGIPGHGSVAHDLADNSAVILSKALQRLADWERPLVVIPEVEAWVSRLAAEGLLPSFEDGDELDELIAASPALRAMFTNTLNVTMVESGIKANVIPAKSSAVIDCRLLPGQSRDAWRSAVIDQIADERVVVEFHEEVAHEVEPAPIPWDTELYRVIEQVILDANEDAIVVPSMTVGGTDNRFLRARGIPAYGFAPCVLSKEERQGFHGNDEFLTVENLQAGCELTYEITRRMCT
ncbi:MAG: M20/M25/M40 family metallo-hydrolase [Dehalococcoidia bacterium]|nr:M20/M25/M40 family metallo-hydrolase [Dehalococcoidia bacterium]